MTADATLTERVLMPVASDTDARTTCRVLTSYSPDRVIAVHVIEKAGGVPNKASVEQRRNNARRIFAAVDETFDDSRTAVETEIRYGTDVAQAVVGAANEHNASAIVFSPRRGGRWVRLLTGDVALSLVTESDRPVIVLPEELKGTVSDGTPLARTRVRTLDALLEPTRTNVTQRTRLSRTWTPTHECRRETREGPRPARRAHDRRRHDDRCRYLRPSGDGYRPGGFVCDQLLRDRRGDRFADGAVAVGTRYRDARIRRGVLLRQSCARAPFGSIAG